MDLPLSELAVRFGCELRGDPALRVGRVATLAGAGPGDLSFLANPQYRPQLAATRATAVVLDAASASMAPTAVLIHSNPYAAYARIAALLHPEAVPGAGVHPAALIDPSAQVAASATIGAYAVIGPRVHIGERTHIGVGCTIASDARVGADCMLHPRVSIGAACELGDRVRMFAGVVIGADGFGFARDGAGWTKVPQVGRVLIGNDVEIGANTTIDRGAIEDTLIGEGVKLDNQIQIGHNVRIGAHTLIAACTGVSGSTQIGSRCIIAGAVMIAGHLNICDDVVVAGSSNLTHSINTPGVYAGVIPATSAAVWKRLVGRFKRLDALAERVRRLERGSNETQQQDKD